NARWGLCSREPCRCWHEVPCSPDLVTHPPRPDFAWPPRYHRHANTAFIEIALDPAKDAVAGKEIRIESALVCALRAVIAAKEHHSAIVYPQFSEQRQNPSDV